MHKCICIHNFHHHYSTSCHALPISYEGGWLMAASIHFYPLPQPHHCPVMPHLQPPLPCLLGLSSNGTWHFHYKHSPKCLHTFSPFYVIKPPQSLYSHLVFLSIHIFPKHPISPCDFSLYTIILPTCLTTFFLLRHINIFTFRTMTNTFNPHFHWTSCLVLLKNNYVVIAHYSFYKHFQYAQNT